LGTDEYPALVRKSTKEGETGGGSMSDQQNEQQKPQILRETRLADAHPSTSGVPLREGEDMSPLNNLLLRIRAQGAKGQTGEQK
jgi:hypothetical protein